MASLSARRAWIEIEASSRLDIEISVALRKESVDRNRPVSGKHPGLRTSLSARRAWIEIAISQKWTKRTTVALRKESVDRNIIGDVMGKALAGRSPQGERG